MKIQFLGTAAFEGIPAIFCDCEVCKRSMESGGRNIRTRSQAIIDEDLLIDFPPDTYMHFVGNGILPEKIKNCIMTVCRHMTKRKIFILWRDSLNIVSKKHG